MRIPGGVLARMEGVPRRAPRRSLFQACQTSLLERWRHLRRVLPGRVSRCQRLFPTLVRESLITSLIYFKLQPLQMYRLTVPVPRLTTGVRSALRGTMQTTLPIGRGAVPVPTEEPLHPALRQNRPPRRRVASAQLPTIPAPSVRPSTIQIMHLTGRGNVPVRMAVLPPAVLKQRQSLIPLTASAQLPTTPV